METRTNHGESATVTTPAGIIFFFFFFFLVVRCSHATYLIVARLCTVRFLSAVRAVAARRKLPSDPPPGPGLSQETHVVRTKEITKERPNGKDKRNRLSIYLSPLLRTPWNWARGGTAVDSSLPPLPAPPRTPRSLCPLPPPVLSSPHP